MAKLELEIHRENRPIETIRLDTDRVLIGSEAYCDVRLHSDEAAPEQAILQVDGQVARIKAKSTSPALLLDGRRTTRGTLASGGTLGLGKVSIRVWLDRGRVNGKKKQGAGRLFLLMSATALVAVLAAGVLLLDDPMRKAKPTAPSLWTQTKAPCPATRPVEALTTSVEKQLLADAKGQRHPFIVREGVEAVQLYRMAAECARSAGASDSVASLTAIADALQRSIDADYRVRQLRLEYSLKIDDKRTAGREASMLRELLAGRDDAYTKWVTAMDNKLRASASSSGSALAGVRP